MSATWLADVLRAVGLNVVEHDGWKTRGDGILFPDPDVVWHHDGSPEGDTPSMPAYIIGQIETGKPGANAWVDLDGVWHLLAAGMTYHAGKVLPGMPGNPESIGVETDHTTGEKWSGVVMLDSLRRGTAAILARSRKTASGLHFHKTICAPVGRKNDPDGLELVTERAAVAAILAPKNQPATHQEDLLMAAALNDDDARRALVRTWFWDYLGRGPKSVDEFNLHVYVFGVKGADACLTNIVDSPEAKQYRKSKAA